MKKKLIEKNIKASLSEEKLRIWEKVTTDISLEPQYQAELVSETGSNIRLNGIKKGVVAGIVAVAIAIITLMLCLISHSNDIEGYVFIDINPSIQLSVNKKGEVDGVYALNDDAMILLAGYEKEDYDGKCVEDVAIDIWEFAYNTGYISPKRDNNAVLVSGSFGNDKYNDKINAKIKESMDKRIKEKGVFCAVLTCIQDQSLAIEAKKFGITVSKFQLIKEANKLGANIVESEYENIPIAEINGKIVELAKQKKGAITKEQVDDFLNKKNSLILKAKDENLGYVKPEDFDKRFDEWMEQKDNEFSKNWEDRKNEWKEHHGAKKDD